jgi:5-deoxy-glucuronate isomerase
VDIEDKSVRRQTLWHPRHLRGDETGVIVEITPEAAGWEFITFRVRQLAAGDTWHGRTDEEEVCVVLLSGTARVSWGNGHRDTLGPRADVFGSYPHAMYVPSGHAFHVEARQRCELAECRAPSTRPLQPKIIRPEDCGFEVRGGGNATRQIVDILPPAFPAHRLLICEVYTPSGNWSSYPPHKHDEDNPPREVDLEETYYFRMRDPLGYGFQRLYTADGRTDETHKVEHNDLLLIREGYHPFVTAYGYDAYYLNVLAGTRRSMAASDDPRYAALRQAWPAADPRLPIVQPPASASRAS